MKAEPRRSAWIHYLAAAVGGFVFALGIAGLVRGISLFDTLVAVIGFLVVGWAVLDFRRFRRGTPESEVDGGHTVE